MKAVTWQGRRKVSVESVPDPSIQQPTDAIIRITSSGLCGSDLHLYEVMAPFLDAGDILGHEPMGIVEEVGRDVSHLAPGDRVVIMLPTRPEYLHTFFGIIAAVMIVAALRVVTTKNVVHAALYLVIVLASIGALYILLAAEFVAATQVLVYICAITVLFLFGIMLTRTEIGKDSRLTHDSWWGGAATALLLLGVMVYALVDEFAIDRSTAQDDVRAFLDDLQRRDLLENAH